MQNCSLFCGVDFFTAEHGIDARPQAGFLGQLQQEFERVVGDQIFRVIEIDSQSLDRQPFAALGIVSKKIAQM